MSSKTITIMKGTEEKIKNLNIPLSKLCRNIINNTTEKELQEYGKMSKKVIILDDNQIKRLNKIKPYNLSRFLDDKLKEYADQTSKAYDTQKIIEQAVNKSINIFQDKINNVMIGEYCQKCGQAHDKNKICG